jgi:hypothetical protein
LKGSDFKVRGKMKKKISFITKPLSTAFFKRLTLTTNKRVVCLLFYPQIKLICGARNTTKLAQEHFDDNARRLER